MNNRELAKILPDNLDPHQVQDCLKIHSSPGSSLGETYVVRYAARWLALYRSSMLDDFTLVSLDPNDPAELERGGYGGKLSLRGTDGEEHVVEISTLDLDRVEAFLGVEEKLDSLKEAEERLSAPPGTLAVGAAPDEKAIGIGASVDTVGEEPEEELLEEEPEEELLEEDEERDAQDDGLPSVNSEQEVEIRELPPLLEGELIGYLKMGHTAVAVRRYREARSVGMIDASEAIEKLAHYHGLSTRAGSGNLWFLFFILMMAAGVVYYLRFVN